MYYVRARDFVPPSSVDMFVVIAIFGMYYLYFTFILNIDLFYHVLLI